MRAYCRTLTITRIEEQYASGTNALRTTNPWPISLAKIYSPYPDYDSREYKETYEASFISCTGPRGVRFNESLEDVVYAHPGLPKGMNIAFSL